MNTQEKELKHCTACNQMTNHSGETCLKHTPDTEWEKEFEEIFGNNLGIDEPFNNLYVRLHVKPAIKSFISNLCSSHTTYWKERVRKEVEGMRKKGNNGEGLPFENSPEIYGNARMEAWKNGHNKALDTLLDNLK